MVGTPLIGAFIAQAAFWVLLALGIVWGELTRWRIATFGTLWLFGYVAIPRIAWWTDALFIPWVAVLDIALVIIVFKGDLRLT